LPPPPGFPNPGFMNPRGPVRRREERAADNMHEVPMETTGPLRDSHGRFMKKAASENGRNTSAQRPQNRDSRDGENPYINLGDGELVNIIRQNIWDGEIDVNNSTHEQLAAFVAMKERIMRERTENTKREEPQARPQVETPTVGGGSDTVNKFLEMLGNFAREAEHNPALAEAIGRFMPRN